MRMVQNVENLAEYIPASTMKMCRSLSKVHRNRTSVIVSQEIKGLQPGDTFAMFIRRQNCGIMIHMQSNPQTESKVTVATFPGKLRASSVYGHASDSEVDYNYVILIYSY